MFRYLITFNMQVISRFRKSDFIYLLWLCCVLLLPFSGLSQQYKSSHIKYIDYNFEFGSPLNWYVAEDSTVKIDLIYDYERDSPNRAAGHWYFKVITEPGTRLKLALGNMDNIWNGKKAAEIGNVEEDVACYISYDKKNWTGLKTSRLQDKVLLVDFISKEKEVYVARIPPYTLSHLEKFLNEIRNHPNVKIMNVGATIELRPLEIIRIGNPDAKISVIFRGRAHPWESGGSWFLEGLVREFLNQNLTEKHPDLCIYIMPMANKDGVARGMTRFNLAGRDLNRNWDKAPDPEVDPERFALENFILTLVQKGKSPKLFFDMHNDDWGMMGLRPVNKKNELDIEKIKRMKTLMEKYTHFAEAVRIPEFGRQNGQGGSASLGNSIFDQYEIDRTVFELNANWIKSLRKIPMPDDWMKLGASFNYVIYDYLKEE